jgi:hypothetical protein
LRTATMHNENVRVNAATGDILNLLSLDNSWKVSGPPSSLPRALCYRCPPEFCVQATSDVTVMEMNEGSESQEFWEAFGGRSRSSYDSLLSGI